MRLFSREAFLVPNFAAESVCRSCCCRRLQQQIPWQQRQLRQQSGQHRRCFASAAVSTPPPPAKPTSAGLVSLSSRRLLALSGPGAPVEAGEQDLAPVPRAHTSEVPRCRCPTFRRRQRERSEDCLRRLRRRLLGLNRPGKDAAMLHWRPSAAPAANLKLRAAV